MRQNQITQIDNIMNQELINLFNSSGLPLHFNKTGNKEFTNYQRISLIIIFRKSKKSLRDFIEELNESLWPKWLGLIRIPGKSTLHDWIKLFSMKTIRQLFSLLRPKKVELAAIDGTGIDSWMRSRHYEKRVADLKALPYAKLDIFIDVKKRMLLDFDLKMSREHDAKVAKRIFKRSELKGVIILADRGYDSEPLHEIVRDRGGILYAPLRKMSKIGSRNRPGGRFRRKCIKLPEFMGQRSIVESVNYSLKRRQIISLSCKRDYLKQREFGWHAILYNLLRIINLKKDNLVGKATRLDQFIFLLRIEIYVFSDNACIIESFIKPSWDLFIIIESLKVNLLFIFWL